MVGRAGHVLDGDATSGARAFYLREIHPEVLRLAFGGGRGLHLTLLLAGFPGRIRLAYHRLLRDLTALGQGLLDDAARLVSHAPNRPSGLVGGLAKHLGARRRGALGCPARVLLLRSFGGLLCRIAGLTCGLAGGVGHALGRPASTTAYLLGDLSGALSNLAGCLARAAADVLDGPASSLSDVFHRRARP